MLNNMIFTVKKQNLLNSDIETQESFFFTEINTLVNILNNGSIYLQTVKNHEIHDLAILKPDFTKDSLRIIDWTVILSPFNVFRQNGKWSLVVLYEDGRLRFWDLSHCKCYLISKFNEFKKPDQIFKIGTVLGNKKRFIYFVSRLIS